LVGLLSKTYNIVGYLRFSVNSFIEGASPLWKNMKFNEIGEKSQIVIEIGEVEVRFIAVYNRLEIIFENYILSDIY
jgi:hypothetical protein